MTYTPEQKQAIADELTRLLATDNTTEIKVLLGQAIRNVKEMMK